jgi:putative membrane protein
MERSKKDYLIIALKGLAVGAGEFIPGFSGATVAYISGIYKEIIDSLSNLKLSRLKILFKQGFKEFWKQINGNFLSILLVTIALSLFSITFLVRYLLKEFPISSTSFLFGIIIGSAIYIFKDFKVWNFKIALAILLGIVINVVLTFLTPLEMVKDSQYTIIILCIVISAIAIYLPGISVSFIFILLGQYEFIIKSISSFETNFILIYFGGSIICILLFSRLFSGILKKYYSISNSFLAGLMIGSLFKLWPWKHTLLSHTNQFAQIIPIKQENVLPNAYFELTAKDPQILYAILMVITGFLAVYLIHNTFSLKHEHEE